MALRFAPTRGAGAITLNALIRGPQGTAATIAVGSTTTGAAASSAAVSNSGSTAAATFNFTIPRGADSGMRYAFESSTTMAAPASGGARLNNATLASVTAIAVNATNSDGVDVSDFIATWDDSTNTTKGTLVIRKEGSGSVLGVFTLGAVTDNTTWLQIALTYVSGSGSLAAADRVYLTANLTGDKGTNGTVAINGTPSANQLATWANSTTIQGVSITGLVKGNGASAPAAAVAGTDYAAATSGSVPLKGNGAGGFSAAVAADLETLFGLGNWKVDYLNGSNVRTAVALGADKTIFASNGASAAPTMRTAANLGILEFGVSAAISVGYTITPNNIGTVSTGTTTPAAASGNYQYLTNNGAFTLAAPLADCAIDILITNGASAGAITFTGFTVGSSTGSALTTTNTSKFIISIRRINSVATYSIYALQ
jgi:hypothetical protein